MSSGQFLHLTRPIMFVGERPSKTAAERMYTWEDGRLAASTLWAALRAIGLKPDHPGTCQFVNLWTQVDEGNAADPSDQALIIANLRRHVRRETFTAIVAMGAKVARVLTDAGIPHIQIVHPAARGKIRRREVYQAHVAERLAHLGLPGFYEDFPGIRAMQEVAQ